MSVQLPVSFSSLFLENEHLVSFHVRENLYHHFGSINQWSAHGYRTLVVHKHHFLERYLAALVGIDPVDEQFLALRYFKLLALNVYYDVHIKTT